MSNDWYDRRHELESGQVFKTYDDRTVRLDRRVPGDGTKWYVEEWDSRNQSWACMDSKIEPGDLGDCLPVGILRREK